MCVYNKITNASSSGVLPIQDEVLNLRGYGEYSVRLELTDRLYTTIITQEPYEVRLRDYLHFRLWVESSANNPLDIFGLRCYATPFPSPTSSPQYTFMQNE